MASLRRRSAMLSSGAAALAGLSPTVGAQAYPLRPVRMVEGYGAGGAPDIIARLTSKWLAERLGQPFVVENKPGASGRIATDVVAKAAPDGYTLLQIVSNNAVDAALKDRLPYDFIRDIAAVAGVYRQPLVMEVHPSVPASTVAEFIALARSKPGKINMASSGVGTGTHLAGELFQLSAGISLFHVPYRGVQALRDLVAGLADVYFGVVASSLPQIRSGKVRALAVTTATRAPVLPDVPSMAEILPGYEFSAWYGVGAPKATPVDIVERLNREVNAALADPPFSGQLAELGGTPLPGSPADFGRLVADDTDKISRMIKAANLVLE